MAKNNKDLLPMNLNILILLHWLYCFLTESSHNNKPKKSPTFQQGYTILFLISFIFHHHQ